MAASPALVVAGAVVYALSGRSPLVAHLRRGRYGSPLWLLKLRTMWAPEDKREPFRLIERIVDETGPERKGFDDARVTSRFARFCRRFSIDEAPQLIHVVRGEMALVGPRPITATELRERYGIDQAAVLQVKPGLTGLWQVMGRNSLTYDQRRQLDLQFVRERSLGLYLRILLKTVPAVLSGRDCY